MSFAAYIQIMRLAAPRSACADGTWLRVREQIHSNYLASISKTAASMSRA